MSKKTERATSSPDVTRADGASGGGDPAEPPRDRDAAAPRKSRDDDAPGNSRAPRSRAGRPRKPLPAPPAEPRSGTVAGRGRLCAPYCGFLDGLHATRMAGDATDQG